MNPIYADQYKLPIKSPTEVEGQSTDAQIIQEQMLSAVIHYLTPATRESIMKRFFTLTATWKEENKFTSSITKIAMHPAYQEIIGMGSIVLPLIFKMMEVEPDQWFWALKAITSADPVNPEDKGNVEKMTQAWIDWGKENGYI